MGAFVATPGGDGHSNEEDYPGRSDLLKFFYYGVSNTVGDFEKPEFEKWTVNKAGFEEIRDTWPSKHNNESVPEWIN